jgi:uncharacterized protein YjbI with pentapeptide repeats
MIMRLLLLSLLAMTMIGTIFSISISAQQDYEIPDWVKNTAGWWANDSISEKEFVNTIEFLVNEEIIQIQTTSTSKKSDIVPDWVKNTAGWWANDSISEKEFVNAIEFLVNEGVINVGEVCIFEKPEYDHLTTINALNLYDAKKLLCFEYELSFFEEFIEPGNWKDGLERNSMGFRGTEVSFEKPNDVYRIFMIGGSTTYSVFVSDDQTIPVLIQKLIEQEKIPFEIEIINAGISGADSFNEIDLITKKLLKYEPDLIIVYDGWNDVAHAAKSPEKNNAKNWEENWSDTCKDLEKKVDIIITLQPFLGVGNKLLTDQESNNLNGAMTNRGHDWKINQLNDYANKLNKLKEECANAYDLRYIFDDYYVPVYFDYGHLNSDGNKIVANNIFKIMVEHLSLESTYLTIPQHDLIQNHKKIIVNNELDFRGKLINSKDFSNGNFKNAVFHLSNLENVNFANSDLTNADFRFAKINNVNFKNTNLTGANFAGSDVILSNFSNSDMTKTYASGGFFIKNDFSNSIITNANWRGVFFENNIVDNARILNSDFSKSYITAIDFKTTNISEIKLNGVTILKSNLNNFDFTNTDSTIDGYTDVGIYKGTSIQASNLRGVNLSNMDLSGIIFAPVHSFQKTYVGIDLTNANLSNSIFGNSIFSYYEITPTLQEQIMNDNQHLEFLRQFSPNLSGTNLANAESLQGTNFNLVNLIGADLTNVNLTDSTFGFANLEGANLEGANLEGANLEGANLEGANLEGANLNCVNHEICK